MDDDNTKHMDSAKGDPPELKVAKLLEDELARGRHAPLQLTPSFKFNYILDENHNPVEQPDILEWARWMNEDNHRVVRHTNIGDNVLVSTCFLGIDHNWMRGGPPILWETMIFGPAGERPTFTGSRVMRTDHDGLPEELQHYQRRYSSHAEAVAGHTRAVDMCLAELGK